MLCSMCLMVLPCLTFIKRGYSFSTPTKAPARMVTVSFIGQGNPHFDIVNLLPSVVIGPGHRLVYDETATRENMLEGTRGAVLAPAPTSSLNSSLDYVGVPVHVADVACAHVDPLPEGVVWDRDIQRIARHHFLGEVEYKTHPLERSLGRVKWRLRALRSESIFGQFTSFKETLKELIEQYLQLRNAG
ncbi:hypothetical protein N7494_013027 [Penicillium frequentans]|uniref:Uncharacterized protein n=1 Tax=Penicillium frequentans TaxID=3151616 RepID=A0AAD6CMP0_9EURO|nr:hypothetical protein N7494_013027 [Penicillium glabrum]